MKKLLKILIVILLISQSFFWVQYADASGYGYQRVISDCQNSKCPASQTNFTDLVCFNGASPCNFSAAGLNQTGGGAHVKNSNGYDIIFSTTACTSPTLMNWEVENYVASTGELEAWVLIPSLTSTGDTFYMCYGNSGISTFQGGSVGSAWNSGYLGVYHFPNGSTLSELDSTSNGNNGSNNNTPTAATGYIDGGVAVTASGTNGVKLGTTVYSSLSNNYSIEAWGDMNNSTGCGYGAVVGDTATNVYLGYDPSGNAFAKGANSNQTSSAGVYNAWHFFGLTLSSTTGQILYLDGTAVATSGASTGGQSPNTALLVGSSDGCSGSGTVDEVRISNVVRSANWITTEYNNQSSPSTYLSIGSETAVGGGVVNLFFFSWI